jgi:hypothetical protein
VLRASVARSAPSLPTPPTPTHATSANARAGLAALDDKTAEARGAGWRGSIRNYFSARVSAGEIGIFPNKV